VFALGIALVAMTSSPLIETMVQNGEIAHTASVSMVIRIGRAA
jgi:hypothetical protein